MHRRNHPTDHAFARKVSMIWIDPDDPSELFGRSRLWSVDRGAPVSFRTADYGTAEAPLGADAVRDELEDILRWRPRGPVRMLTQARQWGWLFNPFTLFLVWDEADEDPVGAVIEVTNTPWKERVRYPVELVRRGDELHAQFDKELHVSPFLGRDHRYDLRLGGDPDRLTVELDVLGDGGAPVVETRLEVRRLAPTAREMRRFLVHNAFPTHRVSAGIHLEAAKLWAKRVPIVRHSGSGGATADHPNDSTAVRGR
jgi:DUF1365 family protein